MSLCPLDSRFKLFLQSFVLDNPQSLALNPARTEAKSALRPADRALIEAGEPVGAKLPPHSPTATCISCRRKCRSLPTESGTGQSLASNMT